MWRVFVQCWWVRSQYEVDLALSACGARGCAKPSMWGTGGEEGGGVKGSVFVFPGARPFPAHVEEDVGAEHVVGDVITW